MQYPHLGEGTDMGVTGPSQRKEPIPQGIAEPRGPPITALWGGKRLAAPANAPCLPASAQGSWHADGFVPSICAVRHLPDGVG